MHRLRQPAGGPLEPGPTQLNAPPWGPLQADAEAAHALVGAYQGLCALPVGHGAWAHVVLEARGCALAALVRACRRVQAGWGGAAVSGGTRDGSSSATTTPAVGRAGGWAAAWAEAQPLLGHPSRLPDLCPLSNEALMGLLRAMRLSRVGSVPWLAQGPMHMVRAGAAPRCSRSHG